MDSTNCSPKIFKKKKKIQKVPKSKMNLPVGQQLFTYNLHCIASLVAQRLKHLPPMRETRVRSLGQEDPLEKEMATCSSILAWTVPWTEEPGGLQSTGSQSQTRLSDFTYLLTYLLTLYQALGVTDNFKYVGGCL